MAGLGTQSVIERAELVTPRLRMRAPRFYPNNLLVRIWRGAGVGNCPGLLYSCVLAQRPSMGIVRQGGMGGKRPLAGRVELEPSGERLTQS